MDGLIALALAKNAINTSMGDIATNLTYKGSVESVEDLPSGVNAGDMYGVGSEGLYAWNGTTWGAISREGPPGPKGESGGTNNYDNLLGRPKINGVTLSGNKSVEDLGIDIPTKTSDLTNDSGFLTQHQDISGKANQSEVDAITAKIPEQASSSNQLADKDFVNSTINSVSAFPISYNASGDGFPTISALLNAQTYYSGGSARVPTTNDYAFVTADTSKATEVSGYASFTTTDQYVGYYVMYNDIVTLVTSDNKDNVGITVGTTVAYVAVPSARYVYSIPAGQTSGAWNFQTIVTPLSLTAAQVKALNSGITAALVSKLLGIDLTEYQPLIDATHKLPLSNVSGYTTQQMVVTYDDDTTQTFNVVVTA